MDSRSAALLAAFLLALCGCATSGRPSPSAALFAKAIPLCDLLANPGSHVGKRVLVRGHLTQTPHERLFMDEGCERAILPLNHAQDWPPESDEARRLRRRFQAYAELYHRRPPWVPVVYAGILKDHSPALIVFADSLSLQDAELVAVGRPDLRRKSRATD